jgi:hypothetical protein
VLLWRYWHHETSRTEGNGIEVTGNSGEDTHALDVRTGRWTSMPLDPDQNRRSTQALWTGRQVLLPEQDGYCGFCTGGGFTRDNPGVVMDPETGTRTPIAAGPITSSTSAYVWTGAALLGINLSTLIGNAGVHAILSPGDSAAWDPDAHRWVPLRSADIRGNANGAATVWTGRELLIWGITKVHGKPATAATGLVFASTGG